MTKQRKPAGDTAADKKSRAPVIFMTLTPEEEAVLQAYIRAQDVAPDRAAVGRKALHEFFAKRGLWPPK